MIEIIMPKMGDAMEEGTLIRWLKAEGQPVAEGEVIAEIGTDKATVEITAPGSGLLKGIRYEEGAVVPVGTPMAYLLAEGESLPEEAQRAGNGRAKAEAPQKETATFRVDSPPPESTPSAVSGRVKASPLARKMAREQGIDLRLLTGSGPGGRIEQRDVLAYLEAQTFSSTTAPAGIAAPKAEARSEPLPYLRKVMAQRMTQAFQTVPHFYLTIEVDMEEALVLRHQLNSLDETLPKVSINDLIIKAAALAIQKHPLVNAYVEGDRLYYPAGIHIGIAVAVPDGLLVAVIKHCEGKSLRQIAKEANLLAEKARAGKLTPDEMTGNTFTISNLGMYEIDEFSAIINPPACAILAVGAVRKVPFITEENTIQVRSRMKITLSCDHRVLDGATAALFLQELKRYLQQPMWLLEPEPHP